MSTECDQKQIKSVMAAANDASQRLRRTRDRMADAAANPRSSIGKRVNDALRANFGIGTSCDTGVYSPEQVLKDVEKLHGAMASPFITKCPDQVRESPNSTDRDKRVVNAAPNRDNSNDFSYYPNFFSDAFAPNRPRTVLHEMAHSWLGRTDVSYHFENAYPGCPGKAMGNADSIASFVFDVGR